jgi:L-asparaginase II
MLDTGGEMTPRPLVAFTRGTVLESIHYGSIAVVDRTGALVAGVGDPNRLTTMRSSAKPIQAMAVVESGAITRFGMEPADLALLAGSHSGEPRHTERVRTLLQRAGLGPDDLQTGVHPPFHEPTRAALIARGEAPSPLHHNCSGKHCGMLCACVHEGWDTRTYFRPDHPHQRRVLHLVSEMTGLPVHRVQVGIDGCGVPTFGVPLAAFAAAFARLVGGEGLPETHADAATEVRSAMLAHPEMVGGEGRFDTDLMTQAGGRILSKSGAEACYGVAVVDRGWGLAVKIEDGGARAVSIAVADALRQLDALSTPDVEALGSHARPLVRNFRDEIVGEARPVFALERYNHASVDTA